MLKRKLRGSPISNRIAYHRGANGGICYCGSGHNKCRHARSAQQCNGIG